MIGIFEASSLLANTVAIVLAVLLAVVVIGVAVYVIIVKLKNRQKEITRQSKLSDYQFDFRLNTGNFLNKLKDSQGNEDNNEAK